jgi:hypothetical protein
MMSEVAAEDVVTLVRERHDGGDSCSRHKRVADAPRGWLNGALLVYLPLPGMELRSASQ